MSKRQRSELIATRYEMLERIGSGGVANVYRAHDVRLDRIVALKVLRDEYASDPEFVARFQREAQIAAGLNHPNVVSVDDFGPHDGTAFIAMHYVAGETLKERLRRVGRMSPADAVAVARQVLAGLAVAHARGLVHRDVKPHNVLLGWDGSVKLTDFGIAHSAARVGLTQTGMTVGTAAYAAPELVSGGVTGPPTDVYGAGLLLYEMLVGRPPFDGGALIELAYRHVHEPPRPPSELVDGVPPSLETLILRALAKDPAARFADAEDMLRALAGLGASVPVSTDQVYGSIASGPTGEDAGLAPRNPYAATKAGASSPDSSSAANQTGRAAAAAYRAADGPASAVEAARLDPAPAVETARPGPAATGGAARLDSASAGGTAPLDPASAGWPAQLESGAGRGRGGTTARLRQWLARGRSPRVAVPALIGVLALGGLLGVLRVGPAGRYGPSGTRSDVAQTADVSATVLGEAVTSRKRAEPAPRPEATGAPITPDPLSGPLGTRPDDRRPSASADPAGSGVLPAPDPPDPVGPPGAADRERAPSRSDQGATRSAVQPGGPSPSRGGAASPATRPSSTPAPSPSPPVPSPSPSPPASPPAQAPASSAQTPATPPAPSSAVHQPSSAPPPTSSRPPTGLRPVPSATMAPSEPTPAPLSAQPTAPPSGSGEQASPRPPPAEPPASPPPAGPSAAAPATPPATPATSISPTPVQSAPTAAPTAAPAEPSPPAAAATPRADQTPSSR